MHGGIRMADLVDYLCFGAISVNVSSGNCEDRQHNVQIGFKAEGRPVDDRDKWMAFSEVYLGPGELMSIYWSL
ncbi:hypothetical protein M8818_003785 [Zalaria obscura]|uniref:Uncharacterized protein n=1 Tax=Zalaria obscura TaxID=2024903 RepID=A0ACC3SE31_9PEZI